MARGVERPLKVAGPAIISDLRRKVRNAHERQRIGRADAEWLTERLNEVEARIVAMYEKGGVTWQ